MGLVSLFASSVAPTCFVSVVVVTAPAAVWVVDSDFFSTVPGDWLQAAATARSVADARNASWRWNMCVFS